MLTKSNFISDILYAILINHVRAGKELDLLFYVMKYINAMT